jgi:hypothetical protein
MDTIARSLGLRQPVNSNLSPAVSDAIATAKGKIAKRVKTRCDALRADLGLVLDHFLDENGLTSISWAGASDRVTPGFGLDLLTVKIAEELTEIQFKEFLSRFTESIVELSDRSQ